MIFNLFYLVIFTLQLSQIFCEIDIDYITELVSNDNHSFSSVPVEHNVKYIKIHDDDVVYVPSDIITTLPNKDPYLEKYRGGELWKIHTTQINSALIKNMKKFGGIIWDMNRDGIDMFFANAISAGKAKKLIETTETTYNVMIDNMSKAIAATKTKFNFTKENVTWLRDNDLSMTWDAYHDIEIFDEFYHYILSHFSKNSQLMVIGRTHEKREIKVLKISNGNERKPIIFITSGIQGKEWIGPAAVTFAISKMLFNWKLKPDYMKKFDWYFLPILNLDGYEYSRKFDRLWSKNRYLNGTCDGVNINRNFKYQWGKHGSSNDSCSIFYRGQKKFSEPESLALKNFLNQLKDKLVAYIAIGSYGQMITYPWGDDNYVPENYKELHLMGRQIVKKIRKATNAEYQVGSSYSLKLAKSGNSVDWVMDSINPSYAFNFYLRDQGRYGYLLPSNFIIQSGFDTFEMLSTIAEEITIRKPKSLL